MNTNLLIKVVPAWFWSLLIATTLLACDSTHAENTPENQQQDQLKKDNETQKTTNEAASSETEVLKKYKLPSILKEVSGIAYLGNSHFACLQDESGIIFIYNTQTARLEKQITFGTAGDYEGIAVVDKTAYVVRSDGKIYEVNTNNGQPSSIQSYATFLTAKNNVEGLTYYAKNNRLLLAIKGSEINAIDYKGIYAFDLKSKKLQNEPIVKISLTDPLLANNAGKKLKNAIQPSEVAVHPVTGDIYVLKASNPQLFILNKKGVLKTATS